METQSQASSAAEKKKKVETIVATKGLAARNDISEKAVASSTTSNGRKLKPFGKLCLYILYELFGHIYTVGVCRFPGELYGQLFP